MTLDRAALLVRAPMKPGVYLMKDAKGEVFYVGKSRSLRARLRQYFTPGNDERWFVAQLDEILADVELLVTENEKEALVLENQLVKELQPRYNVLLKDDKNFLRLRLDLRHPFPRIEITRRRTSEVNAEQGSRPPRSEGLERARVHTFGPYHSARSIRDIVQLLNRSFHLRTCTDRSFAHRDRPCLRHQMHLCDAPCTRPVDQAAYRRRVDDVLLFLQGRRRELQRRLSAEMQEHAEAFRYEQAMVMRDALAAIKRSMQTQAVDLHDDADLDVVSFTRREQRATLFVGNVRGGLILYSYEYHLRDLPAGTDATLLRELLERHYLAVDHVPPEILVPLTLDGDDEAESSAALVAWLEERAGRRVSLKRPRRGPRRALLEWAERNGQARHREAQGIEEKRFAELAELGALLGLERMPRRLECYDISNIAGDVAYGSQVVFVDGIPDKTSYRLYRIREVTGSDDFAMIREVLRRRLRGVDASGISEGGQGAEGDEEYGSSEGPGSEGASESDRLPEAAEQAGPLPDLFVIDGGRPQVSAARLVIEKEHGLDGRAHPVVGLAKARTRSQAYAREVERSEERLVWGDPMQETALEEPSSVRNLLVRLRDEAHRFAISAHRRGRRRRDLEGVLDQVAGIGKKRKRALLMRYATSARMLEAMEAEGWRLPGIPATVVARLRAALEGPPAGGAMSPDSGELEERGPDQIDDHAQDIAEPEAEGDR